MTQNVDGLHQRAGSQACWPCTATSPTTSGWTGRGIAATRNPRCPRGRRVVGNAATCCGPRSCGSARCCRCRNWRKRGGGALRPDAGGGNLGRRVPGSGPGALGRRCAGGWSSTRAPAPWTPWLTPPASWHGCGAAARPLLDDTAGALPCHRPRHPRHAHDPRGPGGPPAKQCDARAAPASRCTCWRWPRRLLAAGCTQEQQKKLGRDIQVPGPAPTGRSRCMPATSWCAASPAGVDKLSTALGTDDAQPRAYRFGYGVLDENLNFVADAVARRRCTSRSAGTPTTCSSKARD